MTNRGFHRAQNLTKREADFKQFIWLSNQLVFAAETFHTQDNLSPVPMPEMSKEPKLAHMIVDIVDRRNKKRRVTLLRYNGHKLGCSCARVQFLQEKERNSKFNNLYK